MMLSFDEGYLHWLEAKVEPQRNLNPRQTHKLLLAHLHQVAFIWKHPRDANRAEDGRELRKEFMDGYDVGDAFAAADCSVLEMLVALSRRAAFEADGEADDWFWHMLNNIGLYVCTDELYGDVWDETTVNRALTVFMQRRYRKDGVGGLFPLRFGSQNQTKAELWYQLSAYVLEGAGPT